MHSTIVSSHNLAIGPPYILTLALEALVDRLVGLFNLPSYSSLIKSCRRPSNPGIKV